MTNHEIKDARADRLGRSVIPTRDEQFYRISGTTSGAAIFGGALATTIGLGVVAGAAAGGLLGLVIASFAATRS